MRFIRKLIFCVCPLILICGNLIHLDGRITIGDYEKDGILNKVFIKKGWFWTTLVNGVCVVMYQRDNHLIKDTFKRWLLLTIWWYVFTQGIPLISIDGAFTMIPPIMDLIFTFSGGSCSFEVFDTNGKLSTKFHESPERRLRSLRRLNKLLVGSGLDDIVKEIKCIIKYDDIECTRVIPTIPKGTWNKMIEKHMAQSDRFVNGSSSSCRHYGGYWNGGHDPSGHIFLLTIMIIFTIGEIIKLRKNRHNKNIKIPILIMLGLTLMWCHALFVTSLQFHTFQEQIVGFLFAYIYSYFVIR